MKLSTGSAAREAIQSLPVLICFLASGCVASAAAPRRESICGPHARCSTKSGWKALPARAHRELAATGETARPRAAVTRARPSSEPLTAQETQVASLARDGLSNPEIGARLFISARTVQYHLSKVFTKFGISSRGQLHRFLPTDSDPVPPGVSAP